MSACQNKMHHRFKDPLDKSAAHLEICVVNCMYIHVLYTLLHRECTPADGLAKLMLYLYQHTILVKSVVLLTWSEVM